MLCKRTIPSAVLVLALAVPGAAIAMPDAPVTSSGDNSAPAPVLDLRSPDARDASQGTPAPTQSVASSDLRSPDARDAGNAGAGAQDFRSPDSRDAAVDLKTAPTVVATSVDTDEGFKWTSAAIGAAAMLAIVLALAAGAALIVPRRRTRSPIPH